MDKYRLYPKVQTADPRLRDHHHHQLQNTDSCGTKDDGQGCEASSFDPACRGRGEGRSNNEEERKQEEHGLLQRVEKCIVTLNTPDHRGPKAQKWSLRSQQVAKVLRLRTSSYLVFSSDQPLAPVLTEGEEHM